MRKTKLQEHLESCDMEQSDKDNLTKSKIKEFYDHHKKSCNYFSSKSMTNDFLRSLRFDLQSGKLVDLTRCVRFQFIQYIKTDKEIVKINNYTYKVIK